MAGQAIDRGAPLLVARHAPSHAEGFNLLGYFHLRHVAVAGRTVQSPPDVTLMREARVVGKVMHPNPRDGLLVLPECEQLLDFRAIAEHLGVTSDARFD